MIANVRGVFFLMLAFSLLLVLHDLQNYYYGNEADNAHPRRANNSIDYYLDQFTLNTYQPDGTRQYHIEGQHWKHSRAQESSTIILPNIQSYTPNQQLLASLNAEEAHINHTSQVVQLTGTVKLQSEPSNEAPITLTSDALTLELNNKKITTDRLVTIQSEANILQGTGMESKLDEGYLRLNANVTTIYNTHTHNNQP